MKINKKILLTVLFLFTMSNTGLPVVLHFCGMGKRVKFEACSMCKKHAGHNKSASGNVDLNVSKVSGIKAACCNSKVLASPISDNYISVKTDKGQSSIFQLQAVASLFNEVPDQPGLEILSLLANSPPGQVHQDLNIINSILLI